MQRMPPTRTRALPAAGWLVGIFAALWLGGAATLRQWAHAGNAPVSIADSPHGARLAAAAKSALTLRRHEMPMELRTWLLNDGDRAAAIAAFVAQTRDRPVEALSLAATLGDRSLARELRDAVLQRWAEDDPEAAANWSIALPADQQISALDAVFAGSANHSDAAIRLGWRLCAEHPELASDLGHSVEVALTAANQFQAAVDFARGSATADAALWLSGTVYRWAASDPEAALRAVAAIQDSTLQENAYRQAISSWADHDPARVAAFALNVPAGPARDEAFYIALPKWADRDPAAAAEWLTAINTDGDLDAGVAAIALGSRIGVLNPEVAVDLAEGIKDPLVRSATLRSLGASWRNQNPADAAAYLGHVVGLRAEDIAALTGASAPAD